MYTPVQFQEKRADVLEKAIQDIQLGAFITASGGSYHASHVPTVLKNDGGAWILETHVARANPHWTVLETGPLATLAIFQGPQAYISPSWYPAKQEHGKVVPTWNYIAVHVHGALRAIDDESWLMTHLNDLTTANESHRDHPWAMGDAPADFIRNLSRAVVGLQLQVDRVEGCWKMIQHRSEADRHGAQAGLAGSADPHDRAVARIMGDLDRARAAESRA